ncbi:hypothetical protein AYI69_g317 [Smittium culicis]|uniref:Uncharacterized protein n=1 Tax=Smittium culicis TaxID=133412 RepID=A0A1R1YTE4_9FUNG|nr:hypothetical protein AYI69_g317 [Smittium culicis]
MELEAFTQAPMEQDRLKLLTDMTQQLRRERDSEPEPEVSHFTTRVPVTDFTAYPELTEALPSEELFSFDLTTERFIFERGEKVDSVIYGIQLTLAQATRSINYNTNRRIQDTPGINTEDYYEIVFASTMRALLSDIAATVNQAKIDNLHKSLKHPGKPIQLFEPGTKPMMDQEVFYALIAKKPAEKNEKAYSPFLRVSRLLPSLKPAPTVTRAAIQIFAEGGLIRDPKQPSSMRQTRYFQVRVAQTDRQPMVSEHSGAWIQNPLQNPKISELLQQFFLESQEYQMPPTHPRPPQTQPSLGEEKCPRNQWNGRSFQFRVLLFGLSLVPNGIHRDSTPVSEMNKSEGNPNICLYGRSVDPEKDQGSMRNEHVLNLLQDLGARIQVKFRKVLKNTIPVNHSSGNIDQHQRYIAQGTFNQDQGSPTRAQKATECWPNDIEMSPLLLWNLEPTTEENAYQCKGATEGAFCSEAQECGGKIDICLFRQHNHTLFHQKFRRHKLLRTIGDLKKDLVTLPENQNPSPSKYVPSLLTPAVAPSGMTDQTEWSISQNKFDALNTQYAASKTKRHEARMHWHLNVPGYTTLTAARHGYDIPGVSEISPRKNHNDACYTKLEARNLVSKSEGTVIILDDHNQSNECNTRFQKRKISTIGKQDLELYVLEDHRSSIETKRLGAYAFDFLISNKRRFRRRSKHNSTQQRFLNCRICMVFTDPNLRAADN